MKRILLLLFFLPLTLSAQLPDTAGTRLPDGRYSRMRLLSPDSLNARISEESPAFDPHFTIQTGVFSIGPATGSYTLFAPDFTYKINSKIKVHAGFTVLEGTTTHTRDLAPRRRNTLAMATEAGIMYNVSPRLQLAADLYYIGGAYSPLLLPTSGSLPLDAFGFHAAMNLQVGDRNWITLDFNIIRDRADTLPPWLLYDTFNSPCGWGNPWGYGIAGYPYW